LSSPAAKPPREARADPALERERAELAKTWRKRTGNLGLLFSVDHKTIGKRYIITAFVFFLVAGLEAAAMRLQLARPESRFLNPDVYAQVFTMHGTTMKIGRAHV